MPADVGENGDLPEGPLSDRELKSLRRIIRDDDRARWFWRSMRIWATYISAAIAGLYASWEVIARAIKYALGLR